MLIAKKQNAYLKRNKSRLVNYFIARVSNSTLNNKKSIVYRYDNECANGVKQ